MAIHRQYNEPIAFPQTTFNAVGRGHQRICGVLCAVVELPGIIVYPSEIGVAETKSDEQQRMIVYTQLQLLNEILTTTLELRIIRPRQDEARGVVDVTVEFHDPDLRRVNVSQLLRIYDDGGVVVELSPKGRLQQFVVIVKIVLTGRRPIRAWSLHGGTSLRNCSRKKAKYLARLSQTRTLLFHGIGRPSLIDALSGIDEEVLASSVPVRRS